MNATLEADAASRPDFIAGIYPAYRPVPVPEAPPPLFLAIADDDRLVLPGSSLKLYEEWRRAGGRAELHVFCEGAHGFAFNQLNLASDATASLFERWLEAQGFLPR